MDKDIFKKNGFQKMKKSEKSDLEHNALIFDFRLKKT